MNIEFDTKNWNNKLKMVSIAQVSNKHVKELNIMNNNLKDVYNAYKYSIPKKRVMLKTSQNL